MNDSDDQKIADLLQADAREVGERAALPSADAALWRAKIRVRRNRSARVVRLITLAEIAGAGIAALILVGLIWETLASAPVAPHAITVAVAAVLTAVTLAVIVDAFA